LKVLKYEEEIGGAREALAEFLESAKLCFSFHPFLFSFQKLPETSNQLVRFHTALLIKRRDFKSRPNSLEKKYQYLNDSTSQISHVSDIQRNNRHDIWSKDAAQQIKIDTHK
jgi:hypothetical protein